MPGAGDFAQFGRTRTGNPTQVYTVSFSTNTSNLGLVIQDDFVTFDLNVHAHLLSSPGGAIVIGTVQGFPARLTIMDGAVVTTAATATARVGTNGTSGLLNITTSGQLVGPSVMVGFGGPGSLLVQNGGSLLGQDLIIGGSAVDQSPNSSGGATIAGAGSNAEVEELIVGRGASGTLNIEAGGRIVSTSGILGGILGTGAPGIGTVNVDGVNSRWTSSGDITVGQGGHGTLSITGGGLVQSPSSTAASGMGGTGTITVGGNSRWIISGPLVVGGFGDATMNIAGGSLVQCSFGGIGNFPTGDGIVTISGAGSQWINLLDLAVGASGDGTLTVTAGAEVRCANGRIAAFEGTSSVSVSGAGSRWTMTGSLSVGGSISQGIDGGLGTLEIGPGGTVTADRVFIFPDCLVHLAGGTLDTGRITHAFDTTGDLIIDAGVLHVDLVEFGLLNQGGTLAPGHSAGFTIINGFYTQQAAATMEIEIGGTIAGTQFDRINASGTTLGGTLDLRLINGFVPSPAQTFVVLDATSITGAFANVASGQRLAVTGGGGSFVVHYGPGSPFDPTQIVLSGFGACPADFNGDGTVNSQDFFDFLAAFFMLQPAADFNHDTFINSQDFFDFLAAFFGGCS